MGDVVADPMPLCNAFVMLSQSVLGRMAYAELVSAAGVAKADHSSA